MAYIQIQTKVGLRNKNLDAISLNEDNSLVAVPEAGSQNFIDHKMNVQWNLWEKQTNSNLYNKQEGTFQIEEIVSTEEEYTAFQAMTGTEGMALVETFIKGFYTNE